MPCNTAICELERVNELTLEEFGQRTLKGVLISDFCEHVNYVKVAFPVASQEVEENRSL